MALILVPAALLAAPERQSATVMLAGGHLPVCSSMSTSQCEPGVAFDQQALTAHRFQIDDEAILRWARANSERIDQATLTAWLALLKHLSGGDAMTRGELVDLIRGTEVSWTLPDSDRRSSAKGSELYREIDDASWWALLDHLQRPPGDQREQLDLDASRNAASVEVFRRFVELAAQHSQRARPLIAVSTASSRDPYDALDFYRQVFEQAGAEVVWLPLDAAVRQARAMLDCEALASYQVSELGSHDRDRVWPDHFKRQQTFCQSANAGTDLISRIDGLFLNGGDQWLTLHAFREPDGQATPELKLLLKRLDRAELVLGGTSAGAAVQSGADMISNGSNPAALLHGAHPAPPPPPGCRTNQDCPDGLSADSLTYHPPGGLGSVPFAIVDTHFSERLRQFRLLQLLIDSDRRLGIGVDETSALVIRPSEQPGVLDLEVVGAEAAWLIDTGQAQRTRTRPLDIADVGLLRLPAGSRVHFDPEHGLGLGSEQADQESVSECVEIGADHSFNQLLRSGTAQPVSATVCQVLTLDESTTATSRLWRDQALPDGATLLRWQLKVE